MEAEEQGLGKALRYQPAAMFEEATSSHSIEANPSLPDLDM